MMKAPIQTLNERKMYIVRHLADKRDALNKKHGELTVVQKAITHIECEIADYATQLSETEAALTVLTANQFIVDETKGSCK